MHATTTREVLHDRPQERLVALRMLVLSLGPADAVPEDADERELMRYLVEAGPGLGSDSADVRAAYALRVEASKCLRDHAQQTTVLAPLRAAAFDPASPRRMDALRALASVDEAAAAVLRIEEERAVAARTEEARVGLRRCMGGA